MKPSPLQIALPSGLVLAVAVLSGCQSSGLSKFTKAVPASVASLFGVDEEMDWADKSNPAVRCVCLWQPADGTWEDRPIRGFGGQVFFLDRETARPVAVRGDVRIHVFDNFGPRENHGKAVHTFDFTKGAWNAFLVKTQFGPAYNVFIPYTRKGHREADCAVRVRLVEKDTPTIFSDMSYVKLDGAKQDESNSTKSLAATATKQQADKIKSDKPIGRISQKDGVTQASVNGPLLSQRAPRPKSSRALPAQLEARLEALQKKMPIKPYDASQSKPTDAPNRLGSPNSDTTPVEKIEINTPGRFTTPSSASPIFQDTAPLPERGSRDDTGSGGRKRHSLAPPHPLDGPSVSTPPFQSTPTTSIDRATQFPAEPTAQPGAGTYAGMIREAELAAAEEKWSQAIRLASKVDRAVRSGHFSWPLDRPTPSALVAQWEVQRIDMAAAGDAVQRIARIDSRVDDYLKASRANLENDQMSEARRLATVAHLISRDATQTAQGMNATASHRQAALTTTNAVERPATATTEQSSTVGWGLAPKPAQPIRSAHPLAATADGN